MTIHRRIDYGPIPGKREPVDPTSDNKTFHLRFGVGYGRSLPKALQRIAERSPALTVTIVDNDRVAAEVREIDEAGQKIISTVTIFEKDQINQADLWGNEGRALRTTTIEWDDTPPEWYGIPPMRKR